MEQEMETKSSKLCTLKAYFVYEDEDNPFLKLIKEKNDGRFVVVKVEELLTKNIPEYEKGVRICASLSIESLKKVIKLALEDTHELAFLPSPDTRALFKPFLLPDSQKELLNIALCDYRADVDILTCNDEIVLFYAKVGTFPILGGSELSGVGLAQRFKMFVKNIVAIKDMQKHKFTIKTAKEQEITTAAFGLYLLEYDNKSIASKLITSPLSPQDGKANCVVASPESIFGYIIFLLKAIIFETLKKLPEGYGYIKSDRLTISCKNTLPLIIDGVESRYESLEFTTIKKALKLVVTEEFVKTKTQEEQKDTVKIENLPSKDEIDRVIREPLPFFKKAGDVMFASVFTSLRDDCKLSAYFMVMMFLSCSIATLGIFLNSSPVVIGAMILAPLMAPIVSLSMGVLRSDIALLKSSGITIVAGIALVLATSAFFAFLMPYKEVTNELNNRLHPNLLDLGVAIFSGLAAAYAKYNQKVLGSVAGVAIAVALVPPLSVAGIGLGWGDFQIFINAMLLFLTNLFGIMFFSAIAFLFFGFSPIRRAKGVWISSLFMIAISLPLYFSFETIIEDSHIKRALLNQNIIIEEISYKIDSVEINNKGGEKIIKIEIITPSGVENIDKKRLKERLNSIAGGDYLYEARVVSVF